MKNAIAVKKKNGVLKAVKLYVMSMMILLMGSVCTIYANATSISQTEGAWTQVKSFMQTWIVRLGGGVIVVGLIFFGMGFLKDDPDGRTRGIQVVIGGAIVAAVGGLISTFM